MKSRNFAACPSAKCASTTQDCTAAGLLYASSRTATARFLMGERDAARSIRYGHLNVALGHSGTRTWKVPKPGNEPKSSVPAWVMATWFNSKASTNRQLSSTFEVQNEARKRASNVAAIKVALQKTCHKKESWQHETRKRALNVAINDGRVTKKRVTKKPGSNWSQGGEGHQLLPGRSDSAIFTGRITSM